MKYRILPSFIILITLFLSSCGLKYKDEENDEKIDLQRISANDYSIGIPTYMTKTASLNDAASLQFQNIFKETYVIVIDESKEEFIKVYEELETYDSTQSVVSNYGNTQIQLITSKLEVVTAKKELKKLKINGLNAATTEIDGKVEGVEFPISYFLTFIEGNKKLYMMMAWTMQKKKDTYRSTFNQIARSFKKL